MQKLFNIFTLVIYVVMSTLLGVLSDCHLYNTGREYSHVCLVLRSKTDMKNIYVHGVVIWTQNTLRYVSICVVAVV